MNAGKIWCLAVAVLVSAPVAGCGAVTAAVPLGSSGGGALGGGTITAADSAPPYKPAVIRESPVHGSRERVGSLVSTRIQRR